MREAYATHGVCFFKAPAFTDAEVGRLRTDAAATVAKIRSDPERANDFGGLVKIANVCGLALGFRAAIARLAWAAASLLRKPMEAWGDALYYKAPRSGEQGAVGWHRDAQYWPGVDPESVVTAIVPLSPMSITSGGVGFVVGSHRDGQPWTGEAFVGENNAGPHPQPGRAFFPEMAAGQPSFHHPLTIHGSGPNAADEPRWSLTVHYRVAA